MPPPGSMATTPLKHTVERKSSGMQVAMAQATSNYVHIRQQELLTPEECCIRRSALYCQQDPTPFRREAARQGPHQDTEESA